MIRLIEEKLPQIAELCRKYAVERLDVFGSAAVADQFDPDKSDLDFLVDFHRSAAMGPADQYFGLLEELRDLFGRDVDLVTVRSLRNPYFIESVYRSRETLYAS